MKSLMKAVMELEDSNINEYFNGKFHSVISYLMA